MDVAALAALADKVRKLQQELAERDKELKAAYARVVRLRAEAGEAARSAQLADARLARQLAEVQQYASAAYRQSSVPTELRVLTSDDGEAADALHATGYLPAVGQGRAEAVGRAIVAQRESKREAKRAASLLAEATQSQRLLETEIAAVRLEAQRSADAVEALTLASGATSPLTPPLPGATCVAADGAEWGGFANGAIPPEALSRLSVSDHLLRCDAAAAFEVMAKAYAALFGEPLCVGSSYRTYRVQVSVYAARPALAARPGTSNHGWGLALDLCGGIERSGSAEHLWMQANAGRFGWVNPEWARPGGSKFEPWHWEFGDIS